MILTFFSMAFLFFSFLIFRSSLNGHSTEICVALIQSVKPNPSGTCTCAPNTAWPRMS